MKEGDQINRKKWPEKNRSILGEERETLKKNTPQLVSAETLEDIFVNQEQDVM